MLDCLQKKLDVGSRSLNNKSKNMTIMHVLSVLLVTGMPGLYRLITLHILNINFNLQIVGSVSTNWAIVQAASMFTVVGWSALLFSRLPGKSSQEQNTHFLQLLLSGWLTCIPLFMMLSFFWDDSKLSLVLFLLAWTTYSLIRQKLIAVQKYKLLIFLDSVEVAMTLVIILLIRFEIINGITFEYIIIIPAFILSLIYLYEVCLKTASQIKLEFDYLGLVFGFSNFVSGGVAYLLVPLANHIAGLEAAGIYSLIISLANIAYLFPRSLSNHYSPILVKALREKKNVKKIMNSFNKLNILILVFVATVMLAVWPFLKMYYLNIESGDYYILFLLTILSTTIGQMNLSPSRWLIIREQARLSLNISMCTTFTFFFCVATIFLINPMGNGLNNFELILICLFIVYGIRNLFQLYIVNNDINKLCAY